VQGVHALLVVTRKVKAYAIAAADVVPYPPSSYSIAPSTSTREVAHGERLSRILFF